MLFLGAASRPSCAAFRYGTPQGQQCVCEGMRGHIYSSIIYGPLQIPTYLHLGQEPCHLFASPVLDT